MDNPWQVVENTLVPHTAFNHALARLNQCFTYAQDSSEPVCLAMLGESRTGKSRALEECYVKHPRHRTPDGLVIPIVRVKTPSKPTVKGLVELMLHAMEDPRSSSGTENWKTIRLLHLMSGASTRMLMIDEFQHFYDKASHKVMHHAADWLKIVVDEAQIALVVSGIGSCRAVLDQNEQLAGRFLAPVIMPRLDWLNEDHREEYIAILVAFYTSMSRFFDLPNLGDEHLAFRCYCGTGGLIGYLVKMLRQSVWNAVDAGTRIITMADLAKAHEEAVWAKDGIAGLRPFDQSVRLELNERLLATVQQLGVKADEDAPSRRGKPSAARKWTSNEVFSARP